MSASTLKSRLLLTDGFGRIHNYLRMSLTEKCNLRCLYCMPAEGVKLSPSKELMTLDERKRIISIFADLGVTKMRFTGGEPTISNHLLGLVDHANRCGIKSIGITTNGIEIGRNTAMLDNLIAAGLTSVNISIDTLNAQRFAEITRRSEKNFNRVMSSIFYSLSKPQLSVKLNMVVMNGVNSQEVPEIVKLSKDYPIDCRFIELMPFDGNDWSESKMMTYFQMIDLINSHKNSNGLEVMALKRINDDIDKNDTTKWYRTIDTQSGAPFKGRVGFISSMTSHFCGGCNRLRITANGRLKVCLFGEDGISLSDAMRNSEENSADIGNSDKAIGDMIHAALQRKHFSLGGHKDAIEISQNKNRPMILIGG